MNWEKEKIECQNYKQRQDYHRKDTQKLGYIK